MKIGADIYVGDSHLTHGITLQRMNMFIAQGNGLDIFGQTLCHYLNPDEKDLESEEKLNPLFKAVMDELNLDKEKGEPVRFEALYHVFSEQNARDCAINPKIFLV